MNKLSLSFIRIILSAFLVFIFGVSALNTAGYLPERYLFGGLALLLTCLFFFVFSKRLCFFYLILGVIFTFLLYIGIGWRFDFKSLNKTIGDFISWFYLYLQGSQEFNVGYGLVFGSLLFVLISGLVVFSERWKWTQIVVLLGGISYFGYMWFNYINVARTYALMFVTAGICRYGILLYEEKIRELEKKGYIVEDGAYKGFIVTILLISVVTLGIANTIKLTVEPLYWEALSEKTVEAFPFIVNLKNEFEESRDYGYYNGYENNGGIGHGKRLGEPVKLSNKPALEINTDYRRTLYLRGSVYDLYSEKGWSSGAGTERRYTEDENLGKNNRNQQNKYEVTNLTIKHIGILSSSGFTPYETYRIKGAKAEIFTDERGRIFFSKIIPKKSQYIASAKIPVISIEEDRSRLTDQILLADKNGAITAISKMDRLLKYREQLHFSIHNVIDETGKTAEYEVRDDYDQSKLFYDEMNSMKYFTLPKGYSERVKELALSILGEIKAPLQNVIVKQEAKEELLKITAIAEYLRTHYEYTLTPPTRPEGKELTDFFLFESKKGYCVHFATSMTLLLRSVGIPARYVEGFVSEYKGESKRVVEANKAHAWVEVYIADLGGWYTFEPTPIISDIIPSQSIELAPIKGTSAAVSENGNKEKELKNQITNKNPRFNRLEAEENGLGESAANDKNKLLGIFMRSIFLIVFGLLMLLFIYRVFINIILPKIKLERLKRQGVERKLEIYLELLLYYGAFLGVKKKRNQTMNEFFEGLKENIKGMERIPDREDLINRLESTNGSYTRARYGGVELTEEELASMIRTLKMLEYAGICRLGKFTSLRRRLQKIDFDN